MKRRHPALAALALLLTGSLLLAQGMAPTPAAKLADVGKWDGMPLFPSTPVAGQPGVDGKDRGAWAKPELVNYPGSVEHFRIEGQRYLHPVNPCNFRTLVRNFRAVDLPGVASAAKEQFAEPVQYVLKGTAPAVLRTGDKRPPVPVVRLKPGGPMLKLDVGKLPVSLYVVRLIAALETQDVADWPKDLIIEMRVNDGPGGTVNRYVLRQRGTDNFYSLGEFFFHAEDERAFTVEVGLHPDSKVDLLVHNVDLHDVLGECARRAGKREAVLLDPDTFEANWKIEPEKRLQPAREGRWKELLPAVTVAARVKEMRAVNPALTEDEALREWRKRRDDVVWNNLPPINVNYGGGDPDPDTAADLKARNLFPGGELTGGRQHYNGPSPWALDIPRYGLGIHIIAPWRLESTGPDKKPLYYTRADLQAHKPYPGLPFDVPPWGRRMEGKDGRVYFFSPIGAAVAAGFMNNVQAMQSDLGAYLGHSYVERGDMDSARDGALQLVHLAYDLPTFSPSHKMRDITTNPGDYYWRNLAHQHRGRHYQTVEWPALARTYDWLFPFIKDNRELADAVGRYVPWVKSPQDVVALLDTYLLQYAAQQMAYFQYYYDHEHAGRLAEIVAVQGDPEITKPWIDIIFNRTWEYPLPYAGAQDFMYLAAVRDGTTTIGSFSYALNGSVIAATANWLDYVVKNGGDAKYSLSDPKRFPRVIAAPYFQIEARVAGMHAPQIGDVGGPSVRYGEWFGAVGAQSNAGWRWTRDPRFAYCLVHYGKRRGESEAEWKQIQEAAAGVRNPFMSNRSRVLSDWGGILEGGVDSDDFRFRSAARVRVGRGVGHAHADGLDLGLWAMGLTMAGDCGARGGYGRPAADASLVHNVATVDGANWQGHSWVPDLADFDGCRYLRATGTYRNEFTRQVALIEVDSGKPAAAPPSRADLAPGTSYDRKITLPRAYCVDFFRVQGGRIHAYNFHGPTDDDFALNTPTAPVTPEALKTFGLEDLWKWYVLKDRQWAAVTPTGGLQATWRMSRESQQFDCPGRGQYTVAPAEQSILSNMYDAESPRKYLRVHVPGPAGRTLLSGVWIAAPSTPGNKNGQMYRQLHLLRAPAAKEASSLFAAVWEPYAGAPFIKSVSHQGAADDARGLAAVTVETVDGITDLTACDLPGAPLRQLAGGVKSQARFIHVSRDAQGIRRIALSGGTTLDAGDIALSLPQAEWSGKVAEVNYLEKHVVLDASMPAKLIDGAFFEVGSAADKDHAARWTTFEAVGLAPRENKTLLTWRKGADCFAGKVESVTPSDKGPVVVTELAPNLISGENTQLALTNDNGDRAWRCDVSGDRMTLYGAPYAEGDLKPGDRVRLYEVAVGDTWRTPVRAALQRVTTGLYRVEANTPLRVSVKAAGVALSTDGTTWTAVTAQPVGGLLAFDITAAQLAGGTLFVRLR